MEILNQYIILDGARMLKDLAVAKTINNKYQSLYKGKIEEYLQQVAPYLFVCDPQSDFAKWVADNSLGRSWGVYVLAEEDFEGLYKHFRKFLLIKTEENEQLYFRFYDPRVLKIFLPSCDKEQTLEFFGPVKYFITEGDTGQEAVRYWQENGILKQEKMVSYG
ncbi:MAG TPA: DUF4123 domain-containing protein [Puia sp.]|nr:DUF4123 domain-containing protein [Puia sp.]